MTDLESAISAGRDDVHFCPECHNFYVLGGEPCACDAQTVTWPCVDAPCCGCCGDALTI